VDRPSPNRDYRSENENESLCWERGRLVRVEHKSFPWMQLADTIFSVVMSVIGFIFIVLLTPRKRKSKIALASFLNCFLIANF
jgi:hypothetical protein